MSPETLCGARNTYGTRFQLSPDMRRIVADIDNRTKQSTRLALVEIGYRGDGLADMYRKLVGRCLPKRSR